MSPNAPLPVGTYPKYSEGSALASTRDSRTVGQSWKNNKSNTAQSAATQRSLSNVQASIRRMRRNRPGGFPPILPAVQMFAITTLNGGDTFSAKTWNGTTLGLVEIVVAKYPRLRPSVTAELIQGNAITYVPVTGSSWDPYGDNTRTATDQDENTETQVAVPMYITLDALGLKDPNTASDSGNLTYAGDQCQAIVFACITDNGENIPGLLDANQNPVNNVQWMELPSRVWVRDIDQP